MSGDSIDNNFDVGVEVEAAFSVRDDASANWVIRRIVESREYAKRVALWAEKESARAKSEENSFLFRFGDQLKCWARSKIAEEGGPRKSVSLPAGTLGFRHQATKFVIEDEASVIAWARTHSPTCIKVVECISKTALNEHVKLKGEIPERGLRVEPSQETFYIK